MKHIFQNILLIVFFVSFSINAQEKAIKIPKDTSYTVKNEFKKYRKYYPQIKPAIDSLPANVKESRNVVYTTLKNTPFGDRDLHVDVFSPKKKGKYPALIMVHGGGWRAGDKSLQVPMAQKLAAKGFVTVCVEYQLSMEAKYPAAVFNIKSAIRWMRANADKYGIDPDKIAISGCSAGGQLALLVGLTNGVEGKEGNQGNLGFSSDIQAIVDMDGAVDFMAPLSLNLDRKPDSPDIAWLGGSFYEKPEIWKDASGIFWANEKSCPILFLNSGFPRFHAGQDELIGMMKDWGIYTEAYKFDVQLHTFWLFNPWVDPTVNYVHNFLTKVFNNQSSKK
ncbi:alpha/beta hydrolase fold domain-containing protein [Flavobacterium sp. Sd200]|uniref:alpha/beta hydrolase n=1 Tax=Flavobacterium sp. Sd200 TaxID=2692211 RepID=UPI00136F44E2|nr:alpha/beta hydrolase [Flavobacterium sp. Sd200]MXN92336.1 alpha/beta hydrolase fold domain-containing protein [Flavobacterium sp. Sd200]